MTIDFKEIVKQAVAEALDEQQVKVMPAQAWTVKDVAGFLNVHPDLVYDLAARGAIPCKRIGVRKYRFHPEEVNRWLKGGPIF